MGFSVAIRGFRGVLRSSAWNASFHIRSSWQVIRGRWPRRPKKKPGAGKRKKSACEKGPVRGQRKRPPPRIRKAQGVPVTLWLPKEAVKNPETGGDQPSAREAAPLGITLPRAGSDVPMLCPFRRKKPTRGCPLRLESLLGLLEKVCGRKTERNGKKTKQSTRSRETPLPPRVRRKRPQRSPERIQKTPGAQNGTPTKREKKGRTAKTGEQTECRGDTDKKRKKTQSACGGVPCDYLICLSEKRKEKKTKKATTSAKKQKRREKNPETPDLTSREFF